MNIAELELMSGEQNAAVPTVSVQALVPAWGNLRKQVQTQRDGRSQHRRVARGLPV